MEGCLYRQGAVPSGGIHEEDQGTDLPAAFIRSLEMDAGTGRQDSGRLCVRVAERERDQPSAETVGEGCGHQQAIFLPHQPPHLRHDDAHPRG